MKRKPGARTPCTEKSERGQFVVRFFNSAWEESESLRKNCSESDAMIELALWLRSRKTDAVDDQVLVLSVYASYPFISIEEGGFTYES